MRRYWCTLRRWPFCTASNFKRSDSQAALLHLALNSAQVLHLKGRRNTNLLCLQSTCSIHWELASFVIKICQTLVFTPCTWHAVIQFASAKWTSIECHRSCGSTNIQQSQTHQGLPRWPTSSRSGRMLPWSCG